MLEGGGVVHGCSRHIQGNIEAMTEDLYPLTCCLLTESLMQTNKKRFVTSGDSVQLSSVMTFTNDVSLAQFRCRVLI